MASMVRRNRALGWLPDVSRPFWQRWISSLLQEKLPGLFLPARRGSTLTEERE